MASSTGCTHCFYILYLYICIYRHIQQLVSCFSGYDVLADGVT